MANERPWYTTPFRDEHLDGVLLLCEAEHWSSLPADRARALRVLRAPGVVTIVALHEDDDVVGFAQALSDGEIQGYLALLAVRADFRGRGVARKLLDHVTAHSPQLRVDTLSSPDAENFYASLQHRRLWGFRLYPPFTTDD